MQVGTSESSLARRVANVERRAGIANAQELGKLLGSMADNGLHSAADFDKQISAYQREEMKLRNEIAKAKFMQQRLIICRRAAPINLFGWSMHPNHLPRRIPSTSKMKPPCRPIAERLRNLIKWEFHWVLNLKR